ncbi:succinylglutamate desuccinylase/aspartoacylase family protein [Paraburkholderia sp. G-4-1-8]|uniref:Succinylglutamate desuccinylase/aspartoacylase family protein n=2 Tax=Paraburkholderia antibiotica TaxID=2728839 RepID=A0A7X9ZXR0_9BURK|nr:succinylglutamate desuccinylase/aspartoacylase family protein [Paraburkholderia antibiotica]
MFRSMPEIKCVPFSANETVMYRFGTPGTRPRVYLQGALHADEVSATLALHYLCELLTVAERENRVRGELIVVPHCNPAGLRQFVHGRHLGRFDLSDGRNFNRGFPDIADEIIHRLGRIAPQNLNTEMAIDTGASLLSKVRCESPGDQFRIELFRMSWGADIVIDVHSDMESVVHLYSSPASWPRIERLAAHLDAQTVMLGEVSADMPFDEAHSHAWSKVARFLMERDYCAAHRVSSCTVELRGLADVEPALARQDAAAFHDYLVDAGALDPIASIASSAAALRTAVQPISLDEVDMITSPITGVLVHCKDLGERVVPGEVIARVFDPTEIVPYRAWREIVARYSGVVFARWHQRTVRAGMVVCKIGGANGERKPGNVRLPD